MPLTKAQIIEIQEAAKFNYKKRLRDQDDATELKKVVAERLAEPTEIKAVEEAPKSIKKGK